MCLGIIDNLATDFVTKTHYFFLISLVESMRNNRDNTV